jgi:hypothetical protein
LSVSGHLEIPQDGLFKLRGLNYFEKDSLVPRLM